MPPTLAYIFYPHSVDTDGQTVERFEVAFFCRFDGAISVSEENEELIENVQSALLWQYLAAVICFISVGRGQASTMCLTLPDWFCIVGYDKRCKVFGCILRPCPFVRPLQLFRLDKRINYGITLEPKIRAYYTNAL